MTGVIVAQQWKPTVIVNPTVIITIVIVVPIVIVIPWSFPRQVGHPFASIISV
jgi:hypothetical protein